MAWETALFVARPRWASTLKTAGRVYTLWTEALDESLVDEELWRPFPELLPFQRLETELASWEIAGLVELVLGEPSARSEPDPEALPELPAPKLTDSQRALFDDLDYSDVGLLPERVRAHVAALDDAGVTDLAARWRAAWRPVFGGSVDLDRAPDWQKELSRLRTFCARSREDEEAAHPVLVVTRNMT